MGERGYPWSYEWDLSTIDIVYGVVLGVAGLANNWFLGYIGPMIVMMGPIGVTIVSVYGGLRYTLMFVPGYLRNKAALIGLAAAVTYTLRTFIGGFDIGYIGYVGTMFAPILVLHYFKPRSRWIWALSMSLAGLGGYLTNLFLYSWYLQPLWKWVGDMILSIVSRVVFMGWLGILISEALIRAGIVEKVEG